MTTKTITIELPIGFAEATAGIDYAKSLMYAYCGKCGDDINGHITKFGGERYCGAESDHWTCQECDMSYCDECVRLVRDPEDDLPDGFLSIECAEKEASYQHCEMEGCEHYRWGDEGHWDCHDIGGVLCPEHNTKTHEEKCECATKGCDACCDEVGDSWSPRAYALACLTADELEMKEKFDKQADKDFEEMTPEQFHKKYGNGKMMGRYWMPVPPPVDEVKHPWVDYKCRAEFPHDITRVREAWKKEGVVIEGDAVIPTVWKGIELPDCVWDIGVSSAHTLDDLVRIAKTVTDCHTIVETLKRKEDYTGKRTYGK